MATVEHNLPAEHTPPIGRDDEVAAVRLYLLNSATPLVTLVGPGGMGKTTLALHLAYHTLDSFPDGVHFIDLTPLTQADLIPSHIARAVGVQETAERTTEDALIAHYRDRRALLLLDNFEHLLTGVTTVGALLRACPAVHVLATSREALRLKEEQIFYLPPLALPPAGSQQDPDALSAIAAVELFVRRAQAVRPAFALTADNAPAVAGIVARLDGLPLAIELAAARIRLFPPRLLLERLEASPLGLLIGGARDAPARQQTARATIAWSYDLLEPADRRLFRRLSVFADGFSPEAIEAVAVAAFVDGEIDTLAGLESLLDKSLITRLPAEDELCFGLLETLRAYALEQLAAEGEAEAAQRAHLNYYTAVAEEAFPRYHTARQKEWLNRMIAVEDNLRLALSRALEMAGGPAWAQAAVQLAGALGRFWYICASPVEGRRWLDRALALCAPPPAVVPPHQREQITREARVYSAAGSMSYLIGDFGAAIRHHQAALASYRALDDQQHVAEALADLAAQYGRTGEEEKGIEVGRQSLEIARQLGDQWGEARALNNLGVLAESLGDNTTAGAYYRESAAVSRQSGDSNMTSISISNAGLIALREGHLDESEQLLTDALAINRAAGNGPQDVYCRIILGEIARRRGNYEAARQYYRETLERARDNEYRYYLAVGLHASAMLELDAGHPRRAARLLGYVAGFRERQSLPQIEVYSPHGEASDVAAVRAALGEAAFAAEWGAGKMVSRAVALALALGDEPLAGRETSPVARGRATDNTSADPLAELTPREREVALLMARGRTNEEIATELFITLKTVEKHAGNALGKLGFRSRVELAAWMARR